MTLTLIGTIGGCSIGQGSKEDTGLTPEQAIAALRADPVAALKATMPGVEIDEDPGSDANCGGPDFVDSRDASKIYSAVSYEAVGDTSEHRSPSELANKAVDYLTDKGWKVKRRSHEGKERSATLSKHGVAGTAELLAWPSRLRSGKDVPILRANLVTDCLRNPDWKG
ncbi:hypothetical protein [Streptomyces halobius]|uniref:Lipoprotein n=1 Tax=Streptomyces halobius TaxID=2879846 RepID=A0ABY4M7N7_9ACTN|nr:hypothetical protein [Streptomyces halobius]UQA93735.1 hypothetical protein K9S39_19355 [Streptomyces halobius]